MQHQFHGELSKALSVKAAPALQCLTNVIWVNYSWLFSCGFFYCCCFPRQLAEPHNRCTDWSKSLWTAWCSGQVCQLDCLRDNRLLQRQRRQQMTLLAELAAAYHWHKSWSDKLNHTFKRQTGARKRLSNTSSGVLLTIGIVSSTLSRVLQAKLSTAWIGFSNVWTTGRA